MFPREGDFTLRDIVVGLLVAVIVEIVLIGL